MCSNILFDKVPHYEIYMEVFDQPQKANVPLEEYIEEKRHLLSHIYPPLTEEKELDLLYGFVHYTIRNKIKREEITSFEDLLARHKGTTPKEKQKQKEENEEEELSRVAVTSTFEDFTETVLLDTETDRNIASFELYQHLKKIGKKFKPVMTSVTRNGKTVLKKALVVEAFMKLEGSFSSLELFVFEDIPRSQKTILGFLFLHLFDIWMIKSKNEAKWGFGGMKKSEGHQCTDMSKRGKRDYGYYVFECLDL